MTYEIRVRFSPHTIEVAEKIKEKRAALATLNSQPEQAAT